eukprot:10654571-Lingulodinium_polyedra.AAC.1
MAYVHPRALIPEYADARVPLIAALRRDEETRLASRTRWFQRGVLNARVATTLRKSSGSLKHARR